MHEGTVSEFLPQRSYSWIVVIPFHQTGGAARFLPIELSRLPRVRPRPSASNSKVAPSPRRGWHREDLGIVMNNAALGRRRPYRRESDEIDPAGGRRSVRH